MITNLAQLHQHVHHRGGAAGGHPAARAGAAVRRPGRVESAIFFQSTQDKGAQNTVQSLHDVVIVFSVALNHTGHWVCEPVRKLFP